MRILLTNDDGIFAKGIEALYEALSEHHDVYVIAPETERSAVGHAITFLDPLMVKPIKRNGAFFGYACTGTPADCVKLGIAELMRPLPDVVVSGINLGANVGINVLYSGTVSAATEGAILGFPALAVSIDSFQPQDFSVATEAVLELLQIIEKRGLPRGVCLNVNVPNLGREDIRGMRVTCQGNLTYEENYERRVDPRNRVYYWLTGSVIPTEDRPDADVRALADGYISITPIQHDLTHYGLLAELKRWGLESPTGRLHVAGSRR